MNKHTETIREMAGRAVRYEGNPGCAPLPLRYQAARRIYREHPEVGGLTFSEARARLG